MPDELSEIRKTLRKGRDVLRLVLFFSVIPGRLIALSDGRSGCMRRKGRSSCLEVVAPDPELP